MPDLPDELAERFNGQSIPPQQLALEGWRISLRAFLAKEYPNDVDAQIKCLQGMTRLNRLQRQAVNEQLAELNGKVTRP